MPAFLQRGSQRVRPVAHAVFEEDGTVPAVLPLNLARGFAAHLDRVLDDAQRIPLTLPLRLVRVLRVQLLHEHIVVVRSDDREAPSDAPVVSDGHTGDGGLGGADDIPSGGVQVDDVTE